MWFRTIDGEWVVDVIRLSLTSDQLGEIITDGRGFTLYMYAPDHRRPSQCSGFCAQQRPPLVLPPGVTRPKADPGVRASLLGTVRRAGGELQETYGGWPLYLWIGDTGPGQATGQAGDMGLWYVLVGDRCRGPGHASRIALRVCRAG